MKSEDIEKIGRLHEHYKQVKKDCEDLFNLSEKLVENDAKGVHVCLNLDLNIEIPKIHVSNLENIGETIAGIMGQVKKSRPGAHVDLTNSESLEIIRMILKFKTAQKAKLIDELKVLGLDIV